MTERQELKKILEEGCNIRSSNLCDSILFWHQAHQRKVSREQVEAILLSKNVCNVGHAKHREGLTNDLLSLLNGEVENVDTCKHIVYNVLRCKYCPDCGKPKEEIDGTKGNTC